jgi:hypothetical protein
LLPKSDGKDFADPDGPASRLTYTDEKNQSSIRWGGA